MDKGNSKPSQREEEGGGNRPAAFDQNEEQRRVSEANSSDCTAEKASSDEIGESRPSQSETLTFSGFQSSYKESSGFLSEVPVEYSLQPLQSVQELKDDERVVCEESLKDITSQPAEVHMQNQSQAPQGPSKLELPKSAELSTPSTPTSTISKKELQPVDSGNSPCLTVQDKKNSPDSKRLPLVTTLKTPDGYNWRKYGQKQVKSPEGSRSYYRCTFSSCHAKKIECCDRSNHVMETVYRSPHNHDPPQKVNCTRENRSPLTIVPVNGTRETTHTGRGLNDPIPSTSFKESLVASDQMPETKQQDSCGSDETTEIDVKEACVGGPEFKRRQVLRQKRRTTDELSSHSKPGKKPKYVVHAAGDASISSDGYRWRKYGQKMVKGNPHPRNYYRCTSAGCPVRKHIERDVDNASALVITYKGVHNHDIPVPRKRHSVNTTTPAAPVTIDHSQSSKTEPHQSATQLSDDKEDELSCETLKLGGEKSSESARTLLSIGFEIKPC